MQKTYKFYAGSLALIAIVMLMASATISRAQDDAEPTTVTLTGVISVAMDEEGAVTGVTLKTDTETYSVVQDDEGKKLAELDGKKVEAKGTVEEKNLTVVSFTEVIEEEVQ
ncbi:hypothetical protein JXA32_04345 [Candidatus Sumerlaeota bacterium]|nr:hypothetical protein [Candidatus Sumerlaeota bacterium]